MAEDPQVSLAIVCEDIPDRDIGTHLADKIIRSSVDWIAQNCIEDFRKWRGLEAVDAYLKFSAAKKLAGHKKLRVWGHFKGLPSHPDYHTATKALLLLATASRPVSGVVLLRDSDDDLDRRKGLEEARAARPWGFPVVIGVAHPKREAWVLTGFSPKSEQETVALAELRQELGFNPCAESHQLTASDHDTHSKRSAKKVLARLTAGSFAREQECWEHLDIRPPMTPGAGLNGLAEYVGEIRAELVPLFK